MQWGSRDKAAPPKKTYKPYEKLHEPWQWSRPWPGSLNKNPAPEAPAASSESPASAASETAEQRPVPNFGARGQAYPGWQRYQDSPDR
jgi:hypothetical protein